MLDDSNESNLDLVEMANQILSIFNHSGQISEEDLYSDEFYILVFTALMSEEEEITMRTFGHWIKEHDFPSFTGYKFFIIKGHEIDEYAKKTHSDCKCVYGFCITDAQFNIIDGCVYASNRVDSNFANKITDDVCEIKIK